MKSVKKSISQKDYMLAAKGFFELSLAVRFEDLNFQQERQRLQSILEKFFIEEPQWIYLKDKNQDHAE